ncbi:MAG: efflux RND transporter periplasmic adaptor subunit [Steroidobacteraceae bacterium]
MSVAAAGWHGYHTITRTGAARPPAAAPSQRVQVVKGETVVIVNPNVQRASHIDVEPVTTTALQPEITAYATVIDLQPLFDLRNRWAAARADRESAQAQVDLSRSEYERNRVLFENDRNVSQKNLQSSRAVMQTDQAKLQSAEASQNALEAILRQQFGDALASAAKASGSDPFQRLLSGRTVVLRVTLPANEGGDVPMHITVHGTDGRPVAAGKLSASPQGDPAIQGNPYFYITDSALPVGTRTMAHVPLGDKSTPGLLIPERAVVWYGGQPWVYIRTAADRFTRRYVPAESPIDGGFFVTSGFHVGDELVIRGAQLLLSEELLPQSIATQCKDPPECDD